MTAWTPTMLGPITEPIFDAIVVELTELGDHPAFITHTDLADRVINATGCHPKTFETLLWSTHAFGLTYGARRIRPTTLGRHWLHHHTPSRSATT